KPEHVVAISDGRIFTGRQAKAEGLVDELGTIKDAINEAGRQGGIKGKPTVYYIEKPKSVFEKLFEDPTADSHDGPSGLLGLLRNVLALLSQFQPPSGLSETSAFIPGPYLIWGSSR
ncbi:MAG: S49 family peptidase, partial [Bdellovibrionia bacterium]